jgi:hypothetical protein
MPAAQLKHAKTAHRCDPRERVDLRSVGIGPPSHGRIISDYDDYQDHRSQWAVHDRGRVCSYRYQPFDGPASLVSALTCLVKDGSPSPGMRGP